MESYSLTGSDSDPQKVNFVDVPLQWTKMGFRGSSSDSPDSPETVPRTAGRRPGTTRWSQDDVSIHKQTRSNEHVNVGLGLGLGLTERFGIEIGAAMGDWNWD